MTTKDKSKRQSVIMNLPAGLCIHNKCALYHVMRKEEVRDGASIENVENKDSTPWSGWWKGNMVVEAEMTDAAVDLAFPTHSLAFIWLDVCVENAVQQSHEPDDPCYKVIDALVQR